MSTPLGELLMIADAQGRLCGVYFADAGNAPALEPGWCPEDSPFTDVRVQIEDYFAGRRRDFTVDPAARGTSFQQRTWSALREIPFGETRSYGHQARAQGLGRAARAVGSATARNPVALVVPCHRVVGHDGRLTGSAMGMQRKQWLISHEREFAGRGTGERAGSDDR